jgi:predicted signal transduction protein with EAL and GGDEF domain
VPGLPKTWRVTALLCDTPFTVYANVPVFPSVKLIVPEDTYDVAITAAIVAMAKNLKIAVIAEGVETSQQVDFLKAHGCGRGQGYYFSRPVPAAQMHALLAAQRTARAKLPGPIAAPEKVTPLRLVGT